MGPITLAIFYSDNYLAIGYLGYQVAGVFAVGHFIEIHPIFHMSYDILLRKHKNVMITL
jgi:hypothetical protein